jgi:hypothetical protein
MAVVDKNCSSIIIDDNVEVEPPIDENDSRKRKLFEEEELKQKKKKFKEEKEAYEKKKAEAKNELESIVQMCQKDDD